MSREKIRPSIADLSEYDELAFPDLEPGQAPAVTVSRARPPKIVSTSMPDPVPSLPVLPTSATPSPAAASAPPPKPKSRFALQREREAAERAAAAAASQGTDRFTLDLDGDSGPSEPISNLPRLVGEVVEHDSSAVAPLPPQAPGPSAPSPLVRNPRSTPGFPQSSHLLFPRKPTPSSSAPTPSPPPPVADPESLPGLLASVSQENDRVLAGMSELEIREQQREIRESMGLSEGVLKMLEARGRRRAEEQRKAEEEQKAKDTPPAPAEPSIKATRPTPPGAPVVAPRQERLVQDDAEEEGSPEYIRRHFFPNEPVNHNLDWMRGPAPSSDASTDPSEAPSSWTFDMHGALLASTTEVSPAPSSSHHVSSASDFTIPSLLSLTASSVPSQRSTSLLVLSRILSHPSDHSRTLGPKIWNKLRLDAVEKAGWALRDNTTSVVSAAISLTSSVFAAEVASPTRAPVDLAPGAEVPPTVLSSFVATIPLPAITQHLSHSTLPPSSLHQLLALLTSYLTLANTHSSTKSPDIDLLLQAPNLLEALSKQFIAVPWPPISSSPPSPTGLTFLTPLAQSSRDAAKALWDRKLVEPALRFLAVLPWELESPASQALAYSLLEASFDLWSTFGRYGIGTSLRTAGTTLLEPVLERVSSVFRGEVEESNLLWIEKLLSLLRIWTIAAIDPHVTSHDILWSHVEGWEQTAVEAHEWAWKGEGKERRSILVQAWELLAAWMDGSKTNKSWRGEEQRKWLKETVGADFEEEGRAVVLVRSTLERVPEADEVDTRLVAAALALSDVYEDDASPATPQLFVVDSTLASTAVTSLVGSSSWTATRLAVALLPSITGINFRLSATLAVLARLRAGDEVAARDLVDWVLKTVATPSSVTAAASFNLTTEQPSLVASSILRPFFTYAIVTSSGGRVVGPLQPTSRDLKLTASLHPYASEKPLLQPNWPLVALNELLRSGSSPVFKKLPSGWDATELEVVRSSLALMRVVVDATPSSTPSSATLIYDLIKVFMLEKDNTTTGTAGAEADLFRDDVVQSLMSSLLQPLSISSLPAQTLLPDSRSPSSTIEGVSSLISSAPFYQLYTDLVGLYDAISLSHPLFSLILLPPLAMSYPVDYRKLVWIDYAHLLRTIPVQTDQVVSDLGGSGALSAFLEPKETEENLLGAYTDALVTNKIGAGEKSFLRLVAVHHVAGALFEDDEKISEARRKKMASDIVGHANGEVVRRLLGYEQTTKEGEGLKIAPECFVTSGEGWEKRKMRLKELVGDAAKLTALL